MWAVVVPISAKVVLELQERVTNPEWAVQLVASLSLPFSWQLLFVASLLCLAANKVFDWRCPSIVLEQSDLGGFRSAGRTREHMLGYLDEVATDRIPAPINRPPITIAGGLVADERSIYMLARREGDAIETDSFAKQEDAFWPLFRFSDRSRPLSRRWAAALYALGILAYAYVFSQNLWWVARAIVG